MIDWDDEDEIVSDLVLLGIVGIQDPVRPEVKFIANGNRLKFGTLRGSYVMNIVVVVADMVVMVMWRV